MGEDMSSEQEETTGSKKGLSHLSYCIWLVGSLQDYSLILSIPSVNNDVRVPTILGIEDAVVSRAGKTPALRCLHSRD